MFPPQFRELPPPCLDLFDLDEQFSSEKVRLAQQTNKCKLPGYRGVYQSFRNLFLNKIQDLLPILLQYMQLYISDKKY